EQVVATLTAAGYRWYETANFCRTEPRAHGRDLRAHHNLGYWQGRDYLGLRIGAVSTFGSTRWRDLAGRPRDISALAAGEAPARELEALDPATRSRERLMLGLRLDEPVVVSDVAEVLDREAVERLAGLDLVELTANGRGPELRLTRRGRFLGGAVTA